MVGLIAELVCPSAWNAGARSSGLLINIRAQLNFQYHLGDDHGTKVKEGSASKSIIKVK